MSAERLRIVQLAPPWFPIPPVGYGGIEIVVNDLTNGLAALGHEVIPVETGFFTNPFASPDAILFDRTTGRLRGGADQFYPAVAMGV